MIKVKTVYLDAKLRFLIAADDNEKFYVVVKNRVKSEDDDYLLFECELAKPLRLESLVLEDEVAEPWTLVKGVSGTPYHSGLSGNLHQKIQKSHIYN